VPDAHAGGTYDDTVTELLDAMGGRWRAARTRPLQPRTREDPPGCRHRLLRNPTARGHPGGEPTVTTSTSLAVLAQAQRWDGHMMGGWGWMWLAGVLSMLLLVAFVAVVVWAVTRSGPANRPGPTSRAREILDERYARGEISTDEYRERLDALR
jgi:putative membrane protein